MTYHENKKKKERAILVGVQLKDIDNNSIDVNLNSRTNILEEVKIKKRENMALALNLPNAGQKPLKGVDLKLAYYSQESTPIVVLKADLLSE